MERGTNNLHVFQMFLVFKLEEPLPVLEIISFTLEISKIEMNV